MFNVAEHSVAEQSVVEQSVAEQSVKKHDKLASEIAETCS